MCLPFAIPAVTSCHVDPLTLTVKDQEAYQKIVNAIYQDAMGLVMMVVVGLMALGSFWHYH